MTRRRPPAHLRLVKPAAGELAAPDLDRELAPYVQAGRRIIAAVVRSAIYAAADYGFDWDAASVHDGITDVVARKLHDSIVSDSTPRLTNLRTSGDHFGPVPHRAKNAAPPPDSSWVQSALCEPGVNLGDIARSVADEISFAAGQVLVEHGLIREHLSGDDLDRVHAAFAEIAKRLLSERLIRRMPAVKKAHDESLANLPAEKTKHQRIVREKPDHAR